MVVQNIHKTVGPFLTQYNGWEGGIWWSYQLRTIDCSGLDAGLSLSTKTLESTNETNKQAFEGGDRQSRSIPGAS